MAGRQGGEQHDELGRAVGGSEVFGRYKHTTRLVFRRTAPKGGRSAKKKSGKLPN